MRHIKLTISTVLAFVGIIVYFISMPNVDETSLVKLTVEAGDEALLDDLYFNGYIYDYSSFHINKEGVQTQEQLSYLEKLDAPDNQTLSVFQQRYPEFMNHLIHDSSISDYYLLNSKEHLVSGHFRISDSSYYIDHTTVYLSALNKETNKVVADKVQRGKVKEGDYISVLGIYEDYPTINILYHTDTWSNGTNEDTSTLTAAEYNFETKNYTETVLEDMEGGFQAYPSNPYGADNNQLQIIKHLSFTNGGMGTPQNYLYNYADNTLNLLKETGVHYFIESNQLYSLEEDGQDYVLKTYNQSGDEVIHETLLDLDMSVDLMTDYPLVHTEVIDNHLYVVQSVLSDSSQKVQPTPFQIFDMETGESVLIGEIEFDTGFKAVATDAIINEIGQMSDF